MEWMHVSSDYKLKPGHIVVESSAGRLILCTTTQTYAYDAEHNMSYIEEEHIPVDKHALKTYFPLDKQK